MNLRDTIRLATAIIVVVSAAALLAACGRATPVAAPAAPEPAPLPTFTLDADHPTYDDVPGVRDDSDVVVIARVLGSSAGAASALPASGDGTPTPSIPHTNYQVRVQRQLKGGFALVDRTITVVLTGGTTDAGTFVLDGGPALATGTDYVMFLKSGDDGNYYPLAGGAALGARNSAGGFTLDGEVTGQDAVTANEVAVAPPLSVVVRQLAIVVRPNTGSVAVRGTFRLPTGVVFRCGDPVAVAVNGSVIAEQFGKESSTAVGSQCAYTKRGSGAVPANQVVTVNPTAGTFEIALQRPDASSGLRLPLTISLQIGISQGVVPVAARDVNGTLVFNG